MNFTNTFCPSPWFHIRIRYDGTFEECRWAEWRIKNNVSIRDMSLREFYNSDIMVKFRSDMLQGKRLHQCESCYYEDSFGKISGRQRQLLKSGIQQNNFAKTIRSSPHFEHFRFSLEHAGTAEYWPTDLQIDLSNVCNSACIMCQPDASSRVQADYKKLHTINPEIFAMPSEFRSWVRDPEVLEKFCTELTEIPGIKYIHFLGGETLYDEAFYTICERLVSSGQSHNMIIGTTTNGTIYDDRVERLIKNFKEFHLGISIETITNLNDYIRYPGKITEILPNIDRFLHLRSDSGLYVSLRFTPNVFTISEIDQMFEYMMGHNVIAENSQILFDPAYLKIELMPDDIRMATLQRLDALITRHRLTQNHQVNTRRSDLIPEVIANIVWEFKKFLTDYKVPDNADFLRRQLVTVLKAWESLRGNNILDYAPQYEKFLRHYGY